MSCEHVSSQQLHDFVDGELRASLERQLEDHLRECSACRAEVQAIEALVAGARALRREIEPGRDLWPDIAREISGSRFAARLREVRWPAWAALAAAALAAVAVLLPARTVDPLAENEAVALSAGSRRADIRTAADLARLEDGLEQVRRDLMVALEESRSTLPPETVDRIDRSLRNLDAAVGDLRMALELDPGNRQLNLLIASTYQKEVELLKRLNEL